MSVAAALSLAVAGGCSRDGGGVPLASSLSQFFGINNADRLRAKCEAELRSHRSYPFDFQLDSIDGPTIRKSQFSNRLLIVDIWATWCGPCVREVPHFVDLHKRYRRQGLAVVGINFEGGADRKRDRRKIQRFAKQAGVSYPLVFGEDSVTDQVPGFRGYPTTLFIDGSGNVRLTLRGYRSLDELETFVQLLIEDPSIDRDTTKADAGWAVGSGPAPIQVNPFAAQPTSAPQPDGFSAEPAAAAE